jgi:hypothetical protein
LPEHRHTIEDWKRLNRLERGKPMVWINEIPWHEMDVGGELVLQTSDEFCRVQEQQLRRTIYQWRHMRADMVVEPRFYCPLVIHDSDFGITEDVEIVTTDESSDIVSRQFHIQIREEADIEKIQLPQVTYDPGGTERNYQALVDLFGDILSIEKRGGHNLRCWPWDDLIRWWGVQEGMIDLIDRPEMVHRAMDRLVSAYLHRLDQYEELDLLSLNNNNVRVGSGGLGYTDQLPQAGFDPHHVRARDLWGSAASQIFSSVSPQMHEEFALQYERRWLKRFGLVYYGCCEPLHQKVDILRSIPNLLKISMSPWIDVDQAVESLGGAYVFSFKPSPALFAADVWNPERARRELRDVLEKARGCIVEVIMKDISTVRYQPQRLWEWADIAAEVTAEYA